MEKKEEEENDVYIVEEALGSVDEDSLGLTNLIEDQMDKPRPPTQRRGEVRKAAGRQDGTCHCQGKSSWKQEATDTSSGMALRQP